MKKYQSQPQVSLILTLTVITLSSLSNTALSTDFVFNGFNSTDPLLLYGNATVDPNDRVLTLTNDTHYSIGRALYDTKIPTRRPNSSAAIPFSTSFIFSMAPSRIAQPGHGLVFLFAPTAGIAGIPAAQNLGFINRTNNGRSDNHIFGVEFDVFKNEEFGDIDANHVGIDVNSLNSVKAHEAGVWGDRSNGTDERFFERLILNNGENYQAWIDYNHSVLTVSMARAGAIRPKFPLLSHAINLSEVFVDDMYVGFTAATGQLVQSHRILAWSFSNDDFTLSDRLLTSNLPSFLPPKQSVWKNKGFVAGLSVSVATLLSLLALLAAFLIRRRRRLARERADMEDWELEYWPHRMSYREIERATRGFSEESVVGVGGNGKVYAGVLHGGARVAVKHVASNNNDNNGTREFLAEVSSLGRLRHRSLVGLRGWCKREKGAFVLVYDYMENGSLDKRVYREFGDKNMLGFDDRVRILKDVAGAVMYLHQGWESEVLHRDIKASNVLLDKDMNGRLGDFGLARIRGHGQVAAGTTRVVGTVGYLAPEVVRSGRTTARSDVFGFGVLVLEVVCGRRPVEEGREALVEWVWKMMVGGRLSEAVDERLRAKEGFDAEAAERVLHLGLLCAYPDPTARPSMRQVVDVLEGRSGADDSTGAGAVECENIDAYLLDKARNGDLWSGFSQSFGYGSGSGSGSGSCSGQRQQQHPTFEDIKESLSSTTSLSWSNTVVEGR